MSLEYCDWNVLAGFFDDAAARGILLGNGLKMTKEREKQLLADLDVAQACVSKIGGRLRCRATN